MFVAKIIKIWQSFCKLRSRMSGMVFWDTVYYYYYYYYYYCYYYYYYTATTTTASSA